MHLYNFLHTVLSLVVLCMYNVASYYYCGYTILISFNLTYVVRCKEYQSCRSLFGILRQGKCCHSDIS